MELLENKTNTENRPLCSPNTQKELSDFQNLMALFANAMKIYFCVWFL